MKAVLVIDEMPNNCSECPCRIEDECGNQYKGYVYDYLEWNSGRPSWCPLRPLPQKMTMEKALKMERIGAIRDIYTTWDACLAEITGDTEC